MKTIKFSIDNPVSEKAVTEARTKAKQVTKYGIVILVLTLVVSFKLASLFLDWASLIVTEQINASNFDGTVFLMPVFGCLLVFGGTIAVVAGLMQPYTTTVHLTEPLEPWKAEQLLKLADQYPALETYRQAVASCRSFLEGDYEAMTAFAEEAYTKEIARQRMEKQAQALAQLNTPVRGI